MIGKYLNVIYEVASRRRARAKTGARIYQHRLRIHVPIAVSLQE